MSTYRALKGFCYLEPKRHVPPHHRPRGKGGRRLRARPRQSGWGHEERDIFVNDVVRSGVETDEGVMGPRELGPLRRTIGDSLLGLSLGRSG
jgi:hypothetical protein